MALREIQGKTVEKIEFEYEGNEAVVVDDPTTGQVFMFKRSRPSARGARRIRVGGSNKRVRVGTDAEAEAAKAAADAKFAPIKAQREADRQATIDAARQK